MMVGRLFFLQKTKILPAKSIAEEFVSLFSPSVNWLRDRSDSINVVILESSNERLFLFRWKLTHSKPRIIKIRKNINNFVSVVAWYDQQHKK